MNSEENPGLERVRYALRASGMPVVQPNPLRTGIHTRGYLPHVKREGAWYFVTFRLADSLPKEVLLKFRQQHAERLQALPSDAEPAAREEIERELHRFPLTLADCQSAKQQVNNLRYFHHLAGMPASNG